jgi:chemotaxis protein CheC
MKGRYNIDLSKYDQAVKNDRYAYQIDALNEMGNIAAAHAATALSKLLGEDIMIDVPESHLYRVEDLPQNIGKSDDNVAVVKIDILKEERGMILFMFPYKKVLQLTSLFFKKGNDPNRELDEDDRSAILEIGNICACAYLNALSKFLDITLIPSPPGLAIDMPEAILEFPAALMGERSEYAIVIETKFIQGNEAFPGTILFIFDIESRVGLLDKLKNIANLKDI